MSTLSKSYTYLHSITSPTMNLLGHVDIAVTVFTFVLLFFVTCSPPLREKLKRMWTHLMRRVTVEVFPKIPEPVLFLILQRSCRVEHKAVHRNCREIERTRQKHAGFGKMGLRFISVFKRDAVEMPVTCRKGNPIYTFFDFTTMHAYDVDQRENQCCIIVKKSSIAIAIAEHCALGRISPAAHAHLSIFFNILYGINFKLGISSCALGL